MLKSVSYVVAGLASAGALAVLAAGAATAATVNTKANVVFIVDESGSMRGEQAFLKDTVVDALDSGLNAAGVTDRKYGVVGYGRSSFGGGPGAQDLGSGLMSATDTKTAMGSFQISGGTEDGWQAIDFALNNFTFTPGAAVNFVLVTDEDRDNIDSTLSFSGIESALTSRKIVLNAIVNNPFTSDNNGSGDVIGIDSTLEAFVADGSGGFSTDTGGVTGNGSGATETDYVPLALNTGGAAWNLNILRAGGDDATSFANAFIDIKVSEIISQPPSTPSPIPLPAGGLLLLTALGGLGGAGALRRRNKG